MLLLVRFQWGTVMNISAPETSSNALIERKEMVNFIWNANGYPTDVDDVFVTTVGGVCVCSSVGWVCFDPNIQELILDVKGSLRLTCEFGVQY